MPLLPQSLTPTHHHLAKLLWPLGQPQQPPLSALAPTFFCTYLTAARLSVPAGPSFTPNRTVSRSTARALSELLEGTRAGTPVGTRSTPQLFVPKWGQASGLVFRPPAPLTQVPTLLPPTVPCPASCTLRQKETAQGPGSPLVSRETRTEFQALAWPLWAAGKC